MKSLFNLLGIEANPSMVYHPQMDRQTERSKTTVKHFLRLYVNEHQTDWAYYLPLAATMYNNMPHSSIKRSPNEYNYGRDLYLGTQLRREGHLGVASTFVQKLTNIQSNVHAALHVAQKVQKQFFDRKKGSPVSYKKGDWVWLEAKTQDGQTLVKTT